MESSSKFIVIYVTTENEGDALNIARILTNERLAACCSVIPKIASVYVWNGVVQESAEAMMMIKSTSEKYLLLEKRIKELHNYDTPEIIAVEISAGSEEYLNWVNETILNKLEKKL